jgi:O-succinylbenzoic acid--CoA ligase
VGSPEALTVESSEPQPVLQALTELLGGGPNSVFIRNPERDSALKGLLPPQPVLVVETSGSTGTPKQVWLTPEALTFSAATTTHKIGEPGAWWLVLPSHYIAGVQVILRTLVSKTPLVIGDASIPLVERFARDYPTLAAHKEAGLAVYTSLVPTQLADLLDAADSGNLEPNALAVFDAVLVGGQRVEPSLMERSRDCGLRVVRTYGAAETAGGCVWDAAPLPGVSVEIIEGRVAIAGPMLAGGYLGEDSVDDGFVHIDGTRWFVTSDLGSIDEGVLSITGRADDVIVSGGLKVSLGEIERILRQTGAVSDAVVLGAPHPRWGVTPVVFSLTHPAIDDVRGVVRRELGPAAQPQSVITIDEWPLLSSGKLDRQALLERASTELA